MDLQFEWDEAKAAENLHKHGVSFEEAITIFSDPNTITIFDVGHSDAEDRFIDIGLSASGRLHGTWPAYSYHQLPESNPGRAETV